MRLRAANERGATAVEFAIVAPCLFFLLIVTMELLRLCYVALALQYIASATIRHAVVNVTPSAGQTHEQEVVQYAQDLAQSLLVPLTGDDIALCSPHDSCSNNKGPWTFADNAGGSEQTIRVQLRHPVHVMFIADYVVAISAVGQNEPWDW